MKITTNSFHPEITLFSPVLEKTYFLFLGLFISFFLLTRFGFLPDVNTYRYQLNIFVAFIFMNTVHTYFTLMMLAFLPEFRRWLMAKLKTKWALFFVAVCGMIFLYRDEYFLPGKPQEADAMFVVVVLSTLVAIHTLAQTKGLSLMYNQLLRPRLSEVELQKQRHLEKVERTLFNVFLGLLVLNMLLVRFSQGWEEELKWGSLSLNGLLGILIIGNSFRYPQAEKSQKRFFLVSVLFAALAAYYPIAAICHRCLHGLEYSFLSYDIAQRSKFKKTQGKVLAMLGIGGILLVVSLYYNRTLPDLFSGFSTKVQQAVLIGGFFVEYMHYFLDAYLFKFSDPSTKELRAITLKAG